MSVLFRDSQKAVNVLPSSVTALGEFVLQHEGASEKEVSVLFVDDAEISELNVRYLGRNGPTDVLAFPMSGGNAAVPAATGKASRPPHRGQDASEIAGKMPALHDILGDVVVSAERALSYAREHGLKVEDELSLYLIHGILHLLGYDDTAEPHARKMRRRERELLREASKHGLIARTR